MIEDLFIPFKLAVIAEQKGFLEPYFGHYSTLIDNSLCLFLGEESDLHKIKDSKIHYSAPLYQQIFNWLDSKGIIISIKYYAPDTNEFTYKMDCYNDTLNMTSTSKSFFKTRKEAMNKAIDDAFKLI